MFGSQTFDPSARHHHRGKGAVGRLPADLGQPRFGKLYEIILTQSDKLGIFGHGYTYSSHPVPAAVALETLKLYEELDILAQVRRVGAADADGLRSFADHPLIGEARGIGPHWSRGDRPRQDDEAEFRSEGGGCRLPGPSGAAPRGDLRSMPGDIVAFCPPLIIGETEIDEMMAGFGKALDDTAAMVREKGLA
jgi:4-aminobutyrate--pyruvate transaminase